MPGLFRRPPRPQLAKRPLPPFRDYETEVLLDSPAFVFPLDEASGTIYDIVGSLSGTASGSITYGITGPVVGHTAVSIPINRTDYFSVADDAALDLGNGPWTLEIWLARPTDSGAWEALLGKGTNAYGLTISGSAGDYLYLELDGGAGTQRTNAAVPADSTWRHYVVTRSASGAGNTIIYVDGVAVAMTDVTPAATFVDTATALIIGMDSTDNGGGRMAYLAGYKSVLSADRIAAHYAARNVLPATPDEVVEFKTGSDTGSGADASSALAAALAGSDTGTGVDATSAADRAVADTGAGAEGAPAIAIATSDTGTGVDAGTVSVPVAASDTGTGTDATSAFAIASTDTGSGVDVSTAPVVVLASSDTGAGVDAASAFAFTSVDTGTGADGSGVLAAAWTVTDTGAGADGSGVLEAAIAASDTTTGVDAVFSLDVPTFDVSASDTGTGVDASAALAVELSDTGAGTDVTAAFALALTDTGAGADVAALAAAAAGTDSATGMDASTAPVVALASSDTGTGVDVSTDFTFTATDDATGVDVVFSLDQGLTSIEAHDTGSGADEMASITVYASDDGTGTDASTAPVATYTITGITRNQNGAAIPNCTVDLFRSSDNTFVDTTTSDGVGRYTVTVSDGTTEHFLVAYSVAKVYGVTARDIVGV